MSDISENLAAIDRYIKGAKIKTAKASDLYDEWTSFYNGIGFWDDTQENYDKARNIRNKFNLANATTREEYDHVTFVIETGMTTEEMAGGTRRSLISGMYEEPIISADTKNKFILAAVVVGGAFVLLQITKLAGAVNPLFQLLKKK